MQQCVYETNIYGIDDCETFHTNFDFEQDVIDVAIDQRHDRLRVLVADTLNML